MLGGLFFAAKAQNLGIANALKSGGSLSGMLAGRNATNITENSDINVSRSSMIFPSSGRMGFGFRVFRYVVYPGGGGGGGTATYGAINQDGEGGTAGKRLEFLGVWAVMRGWNLSGGAAGVNQYPSPTAGQDGRCNIPPAYTLMPLNSTWLNQHTGKGGRAWDSGPNYNYAGEVSTFPPYGNGGNGGYGSGASAEPATKGNDGRVDLQGLVW